MSANSHRQAYLYIDPRTKMLLVLCCGTLFSRHMGMVAEIAVFFVVFAIGLFVHGVKSAAKIFIFYSLAGLLPLLLLHSIEGFMTIFFTALSTLVLIFTPAVYALNIITKTTTVSDSVSALRKMHLSDSVVIPIAVFFRFVPTLKEEWQSIRSAMKLRGIGTSFLNVVRRPILNMEYVLIPLMMSTANIADELAAASISRGLAKGVNRVPISEVKFRVADYIIIVGFPVMLAILYSLKQKAIW